MQGLNQFMPKSIVYILLIFTLSVSLICSLVYPVNSSSIYSYFFLEQNTDLFWHLRFSRVIASFVVGFLVGVAGYLTQLMFRNSLAAPSILGVTATGTAFSTFVILVSASLPSLEVLIGSSLTGVMLVVGFWFIIQRSLTPDVGKLLLIGFGINILMGAVSGLFLALSREDPNKSRLMLSWVFGGLSYVDVSHLLLLLIVLVFFLIFFAFKKPQLEFLNLGESVAHTYGVDVNKLKVWILFIVSISIGVICAICGNVPFIGVIAPIMARGLGRFSMSEALFLGGGIGGVFFVIADFASRTLIYPNEVEAGILTGIIAAPIFLWILIKGEKLV